MKVLQIYIKEIKIRLYYFTISFILLSICSYQYTHEFLLILSIPILRSLRADTHFIFTELTEAFWSHTISWLFFSCLLIYPVVCYQVLCFFKGGLYSYEIISLTRFLVASILLSYIGLFIGYKLLLPIYCDFFLSWESEHANLEARMLPYIKVVTKTLYICSLSPIFILFLIVRFQHEIIIISRARKIILVSVFILIYSFSGQLWLTLSTWVGICLLCEFTLFLRLEPSHYNLNRM